MRSVELMLPSRHMKLKLRPPWREQHICKLQPSVVQTASEWRWLSAKLPKQNYLSWLLARSLTIAMLLAMFVIALWSASARVWVPERGTPPVVFLPTGRCASLWCCSKCQTVNLNWKGIGLWKNGNFLCSVGFLKSLIIFSSPVKFILGFFKLASAIRTATATDWKSKHPIAMSDSSTTTAPEGLCFRCSKTPACKAKCSRWGPACHMLVTLSLWKIQAEDKSCGSWFVL